MISDTRIIELADCTLTSDLNDDDLIAFANALQAEWIKSLGEPVGEIVTHCETPMLGFYRPLNDLLSGAKLYALPNEEVK